MKAKTFYQLHLEQLEAISNRTAQGKEKPSLLLHACCAPCSSAVLERLSSYFDISIYYYNPNIHPEAEYTRRLEELKTFLGKLPSRFPLVTTGYNPEEYFAAVRTKEEPELQTEPECGERCRRCYEFRMKAAFQYAQAHGFDYFTTTLSISPHKDAAKINTIGEMLQPQALSASPVPQDAQQKRAPVYLYADFKKKNGYLRSLELSKEYGLYRQDYCGCVYSQT